MTAVRVFAWLHNRIREVGVDEACSKCLLKLATDFYLEAPSRQVGVFDTDDRYCIIEQGDPPTGGCIGGKESTVDGVVDKCGSRGPGDGKCEQACGADAACDEKLPNDLCISGGKFGRCSDYCSCCVASDSDNGKDYLKKGTATGLMLEGGYLNCSTKTDSCYNDVLIEYYIDDSGHLNYEYHYCGSDENKKCVDGHCGCEYDSDCAVNGKCCSPSGSLKKGSADCPDYDYLCKWPKCGSNPECVDGYCCVTSSQDSNWANQGRCERRGIYPNNSTWLCAPKQ